MTRPGVPAGTPGRSTLASTLAPFHSSKSLGGGGDSLCAFQAVAMGAIMPDGGPGRRSRRLGQPLWPTSIDSLPRMRSTVSPLEGNKVKLSVEVDETEFDRALDAAFRKIAREVRIPGFR